MSETEEKTIYQSYEEKDRTEWLTKMQTKNARVGAKFNSDLN